MEYRWFNVPSEMVTDPVTGEDEPIPMFKDRVESSIAFRLGQSGRYCVRFYSDSETLDSIGAEQQATELADEAAKNYLNNVRERDFTVSEMNNKFSDNLKD